ncbi:MAG: type II toxin-antitoxin system RelE/ParE family toxin [Dehalococcoidales bacterium]|nr:type II toxin-antitoxin system RelE/ParE family toxin [Dehalococcoidales bacterium]
MSYQVRLRRATQKQLDRLTGRDYEVIAGAISALEQEPRPRGVKKLAESGLWRVRVGQCRIVYSVNDKEYLVVVVRLARRTEDTYKRL